MPQNDTVPYLSVNTPSIRKSPVRWVALGVLIVLVMGGAYGLYLDHHKPPTPWANDPAVKLHADDETVYYSHGSNLFHYSNCPDFGPHMKAAIGYTALQLYESGKFAPCPRCAVKYDASDGTTHFAYPANP